MLGLFFVLVGLFPRLACSGPMLASGSLAQRVGSPRLVPREVAQKTSVVCLRGFLDGAEIEACSSSRVPWQGRARLAPAAAPQELHSAAARVREVVGDVERSNGLRKGSWRTTYINHRLPQLLPALDAKLHAAFREVDASVGWGLLDEARAALSLRVAEYHVVELQGGLPIPNHVDYGSLMTLDIMLSDRRAFEGGEFQTLEADGSLLSHPFERGDALVFQSHKFHCVQPVTAGRRNVFIAELWEGLPRRCPRRCTEPWSACYCAFRPTALYQRHDSYFERC